MSAPLTIVVTGPGGVGKGTVVSALIEHDPSLWLSRSWTTRDPRPGEPDDAYVFVDRARFEEHAANGGFFEYAEFLGNLYGTPIPDPPDGSDVLLEIEVQGAQQVLASDPDAVLILLEAPSMEQQQARLRGRGDPEQKVQQRVEKAAEEIAVAEQLKAHRVINTTVDDTVAELAGLISRIRAERAALQQAQQAQQAQQ